MKPPEEENKTFVNEMSILNILKGKLDDLPYERYQQFVKHSNKGENCVYARKAVEYYKRFMREQIKLQLEETLALLKQENI